MRRRSKERLSDTLTAVLLSSTLIVSSGMLSDAVAICGDSRLVGEELGPLISEVHPDCGSEDAVSLSKVADMTLEPAAVVNCRLARALADWSEDTLAPLAERRFQAEVVAAVVVDSYSCRPRNRQEGARLSEHSFANAIDISAFRLSDGTLVTVLKGWEVAPVEEAAAARPADKADADELLAREEAESAFLRELWAASCGGGDFGTVLGPEANALHADHLHFDGRERRSAWCE